MNSTLTDPRTTQRFSLKQGQNGQNGRNDQGQTTQNGAPTAGKSQWSRNASGFRGGGPQQYQPGGRGYHQPRPQGTGANETPLGTPLRMSPVTISPASPSGQEEQKIAPVANGSNGAKAEQAGEGMGKKDKKRKAEAKVSLCAPRVFKSEVLIDTTA